jgi:hypothetical protein
VAQILHGWCHCARVFSTQKGRVRNSVAAAFWIEDHRLVVPIREIRRLVMSGVDACAENLFQVRGHIGSRD